MQSMIKRIVLLAFVLSASFLLAAGCAQEIDFASRLALNLQSGSAKTEASVKTFVDGDTVHFAVPASVSADGALKARFLAVNTPEITGKVEEYGKRAADFTREKLENAASILLESDDGRWNLDSTGERYLVWVWYRPSLDAPYRCLNIELLQNGLAKANSTASNRYGTIASEALEWGKGQKLHLYSGAPDPDFYYGDAIELTLRELRTHAADYVGKKVAFSGVVTFNEDNAVYVEDVDEETGLPFGMPVYYGFGLSGKGLSILKPGNEVRVVGTMQYYEAGDVYQVSDVNYRMMKPKDPGNLQLLSEGHQPAYTPMMAETYAAGSVTLEGKTYASARLALGASVSLEGLEVTDAFQSAETGEMTLKCKAGGYDIRVRTLPFQGVSEQTYLGKTIDVKGIVDCFGGVYQVKAFTPDAITVND